MIWIFYGIGEAQCRGELCSPAYVLSLKKGPKNAGVAFPRTPNREQRTKYVSSLVALPRADLPAPRRLVCSKPIDNTLLFIRELRTLNNPWKYQKYNVGEGFLPLLFVILNAVKDLLVFTVCRQPQVQSYQ